jgi:hypothetical protein
MLPSMSIGPEPIIGLPESGLILCPGDGEVLT